MASKRREEGVRRRSLMTTKTTTYVAYACSVAAVIVTVLAVVPDAAVPLAIVAGCLLLVCGLVFVFLPRSQGSRRADADEVGTLPHHTLAVRTELRYVSALIDGQNR
jgi:hypothetical protein